MCPSATVVRDHDTVEAGRNGAFGGKLAAMNWSPEGIICRYVTFCDFGNIRSLLNAL